MTTTRTPRRDLSAFAVLSIVTAIVVIGLKLIAWRVTGSVGLLSDALESTVNLVAAIGAFVALRVAAKPPDRSHNFGHTKAEYLSAVFEGVMIVVAAVVIVATAVDRLLHPEELDEVGMGLAISVGATSCTTLRFSRLFGERWSSVRITRPVNRYCLPKPSSMILW